MKNINIETLKIMLKNPQDHIFIDVRTKDEFSFCRIEDFKNLPLGNLKETAPHLATSKNWVISCKSGFRSQKACQLLSTHHDKIFNVEGGIDAWQKAGHAVVKKQGHGVSIMRQVQIIVGLATLSGVLMGQYINNNFIWLAAFVGAGMLFAGLSNTCALGILLSKAPWNRN